MKKILTILVLFLCVQGLAQCYENQVNVAATTSPFDAPELSTFKELATAADVITLFQGTGPFTAFVPTNAAFAKLGREKLDELRKPENKDRLANLILDHVISGKYLSRGLKTMRVKTVGGEYLNIDVDDNMIKVNKAKVVKADLIGPNGVVYEIDTVIIFED